MNDPNNALWAGIFYTAAGLCGLMRHFLLEPSSPNFPKAPAPLLIVFFMFSTILVVFGLRFLFAFHSGESTVPPNATAQGVFLALALFVYKFSMLCNVIRQYYPAEVWRRLDTIAITVKKSCPHRFG